MTNGEKIQQIFPNAEINYGLRGVVAITFIHKTIFDLDWWNAEYQESSSSGKPNKSEIPTGSTTKNDLGVEKIEVRKPCINYEDGCEEWAGCPCVHFKGRM